MPFPIIPIALGILGSVLGSSAGGAIGKAIGQGDVPPEAEAEIKAIIEREAAKRSAETGAPMDRALKEMERELRAGLEDERRVGGIPWLEEAGAIAGSLVGGGAGLITRAGRVAAKQMIGSGGRKALGLSPKTAAPSGKESAIADPVGDAPAPAFRKPGGPRQPTAAAKESAPYFLPGEMETKFPRPALGQRDAARAAEDVLGYSPMDKAERAAIQAADGSRIDDRFAGKWVQAGSLDDYRGSGAMDLEASVAGILPRSQRTLDLDPASSRRNVMSFRMSDLPDPIAGDIADALGGLSGSRNRIDPMDLLPMRDADAALKSRWDRYATSTFAPPDPAAQRWADYQRSTFGYE